jgi:hypothetical protein
MFAASLQRCARPWRRHGVSLLAAIALASLAGCNTGRFPVSGEVTVNGKSISEGTISFEPADGQGPTTGGKIADGNYQLEGNAAPLPGKKTVRIFAARKTGRKVQAGPPSPPGTMVEEIERYIPDIYNTKTTLSCEVGRQGANRIDFRLKGP